MRLNVLIGILLICTATACSSMTPQLSEKREADLVRNGYAAMTAEDYATAENLFRQALAMNHLNPYTLLNLGVVYHQTGRYEDARRTYQTLIDLNPSQTAEATSVEGYSGIKLVEIAKVNMGSLPKPLRGALEDAQRDLDGDGIPNGSDQCSNTPAGAAVNATGCWSLKNLFASGKSLIQPSARSQLEAVVAIMKKNPPLRIEIQGHTDNVGSALLNQRLSEKRALAVLRYLVKHGIDLDRLESAGYGSAHPIASNDSAKGRKLNRRVELQPLN
jgi:outer membrane protein OmpA-like peptidoglycan-associated protein